MSDYGRASERLSAVLSGPYRGISWIRIHPILLFRDLGTFPRSFRGWDPYSLPI